MRSILFRTAGVALLMPVVAIGQAQPPVSLPPGAVVQARQAQFREIGTAYKAINDELKKSAPSKFVMTSSARQIVGNLRQTAGMFPAGSGPSSRIKTKALPAIWSRQAEFSRLNGAAIAAGNNLVLAMRVTDPSAINAEVRALGRACQACHQLFRLED